MTADDTIERTDTRITATNPVNTPDKTVVNKKETRTSTGANKLSSMFSQSRASKKLGFVPKRARPVDQEDQHSYALLVEAGEAVAELDHESKEEKEHRSEYKQQNIIGSYRVLRKMLVFMESFKDNDGKINASLLESFLLKYVGKRHATEKTYLHRISKFCSTKNTAKVMITKRAWALDTIVHEGYGSDNLENFLEEEQFVGPDRIKSSGMRKCILLFQERNGLLATSKDKYAGMDKPKLINLGRDAIDELSRRGIIPAELKSEFLKRLDAPETTAEQG